jgi:hypothetical protein
MCGESRFVIPNLYLCGLDRPTVWNQPAADRV